jgi:TM2 domain-containing membrane protein YozV
MKLFLLLVLTLSSCISVVSAQSDTAIISTYTPQESSVADSLTLPKGKKSTTNQTVKPKRRLVAALLCLTLGPFGMHRLYLGTKPQVAAAYTLTLGGGCGLITVVDLFHIVFSPDISRFKNNDQFIMWKK